MPLLEDSSGSGALCLFEAEGNTVVLPPHPPPLPRAFLRGSSKEDELILSTLTPSVSAVDQGADTTLLTINTS